MTDPHPDAILQLHSTGRYTHTLTHYEHTRAVCIAYHGKPALTACGARQYCLLAAPRPAARQKFVRCHSQPCST